VILAKFSVTMTMRIQSAMNTYTTKRSDFNNNECLPNEELFVKSSDEFLEFRLPDPELTDPEYQTEVAASEKVTESCNLCSSSSSGSSSSSSSSSRLTTTHVSINSMVMLYIHLILFIIF